MKRRQGFAIWLTGLPSSGKSTLARMLHSALEEGGFPSEVLDGDEVRERLTKGLGFSKKDRDENIRRIAFVAKLLTRVGGVAITAAISPYRASRDLARVEIGNFVEVYVQCPLQVCMQRDVKGLYAKALSGEVRNFTGISDPYEPPLEAEVVVHTERESREESLRTIIEKLIAMNLVPYHLLDRLPSERPEMNAVDASGATPRSHWMI